MIDTSERDTYFAGLNFKPYNSKYIFGPEIDGEILQELREKEDKRREKKLAIVSVCMTNIHPIGFSKHG